MPKTKPQSLFFTAVTAWMMVYGMTLYNIVLASGSFTNMTFGLALKEMWLEFVVIFFCAYFISSPLAKRFAFRIVKPDDRPIVLILTIQVFTVIFQVLLASILGAWHAYGFTANFLPDYLICVCENFIMALPMQLIVVGPIAKGIFRAAFRVEAA